MCRVRGESDGESDGESNGGVRRRGPKAGSGVVTAGGVERERRGLIQAKAAEGSGRRSHSVATPVASFCCLGPYLLL